MPNVFADERELMAVGVNLFLVTDGSQVTLNQNRMYLKVTDTSGAVGVTVSDPSTLPLGLTFTLDASLATGTVTISPGSHTVDAGQTREFQVRVNDDSTFRFVGTADEDASSRIADIETDIDNIEAAMDLLEGRSTAALISAALSGDKTNGTGVVLDEGVIAVSSSISWGDGLGGWMVGQGAIEPYVQAHGNRALATTLYADATLRASGDPLLEVTRGHCTAKRFAVDGGTAAQFAADSYGPIGIHMKRSSNSGIDTGKWLLEQIRFNGWDIGLKLGTALADSNCDVSVYNRCTWHKCTAAIELNNTQAMDHEFNGCEWWLCDDVFYIKAGGAIITNGGALLTPGTFFWMSFDSGFTGFGVNNANYVCRDLKLDNAAAGALMCDGDQNGGYLAKFMFDRVHFPGVTWGGPAFHLHNYQQALIVDCLNLQKGMVRWTHTAGDAPVVEIVRGTHWFDSGTPANEVSDATDILDSTGSSGTIRVKITDVRQYLTGVAVSEAETTVTV